MICMIDNPASHLLHLTVIVTIVDAIVSSCYSYFIRGWLLVLFQ